MMLATLAVVFVGLALCVIALSVSIYRAINR